jgi:Kef-type K+ transport system membrane component KefB/mannitol/fructose-specific phosphotransferase system IIA component (Ntr-type)
MAHLNEQNIFLFLVQLFLLLGLSRGLGEIFRRWKQPALTAEILVGIVLGPTILGRFFPGLWATIFPSDPAQHDMIETVGWLGVLFLLMETGLEVDFSSAWRQRGDALKIALADIVVPMAIAFPACLFLPTSYLVNPEQRLIFAMFMATVMTISAMPVAARALHDLNISKTDMGFLIMSALSVNDIIGWLLFTMVLGFFTQTGLELTKTLIMLGGTAGFTLLCLTVGRRFASWVISEIRRRGMPEPATSLTFISLLGVVCGAITQLIGIHALFGFFIAGVMAGQARALSERTRQVISQMVYAIFVPIFFAGIGLRIDFLGQFDWFLVAFLAIIGIGGRYLGAWLGVSLTQLPRDDRMPISVSHTPGGAMEIVIALLALQFGLITQTVFVAIVFGAIVSSVALGPWMSYSLSRRKAVSLLEYLTRASIVSDLKATTRNRALEELSELAAEQTHAYEAGDIYLAALNRENEMGTALEEGIAVPHARLPKLDRPVVVFGRSRTGIDWNSPDGEWTRFIFLVLAPPRSDLQVQILAMIVRTMNDASIREQVLRAENSAELWSVLQRAFAAQRVVKQTPNRSKQLSRT